MYLCEVFFSFIQWLTLERSLVRTSSMVTLAGHIINTSHPKIYANKTTMWFTFFVRLNTAYMYIVLLLRTTNSTNTRSLYCYIPLHNTITVHSILCTITITLTMYCYYCMYYHRWNCSPNMSLKQEPLAKTCIYHLIRYSQATKGRVATPTQYVHYTITTITNIASSYQTQPANRREGGYTYKAQHWLWN